MFHTKRYLKYQKWKSIFHYYVCICAQVHICIVVVSDHDEDAFVKQNTIYRRQRKIIVQLLNINFEKKKENKKYLLKLMHFHITTNVQTPVTQRNQHTSSGSHTKPHIHTFNMNNISFWVGIFFLCLLFVGLFCSLLIFCTVKAHTGNNAARQYLNFSCYVQNFTKYFQCCWKLARNKLLLSCKDDVNH